MKAHHAGALILFARAPRVGFAKTRLIPAFGAARAAEIYDHLLKHALRCSDGVPNVARYIFIDQESAREHFEATLGSAWTIAVQMASDLGARMSSAMVRVLEVHQHALLFGSDIIDMTLDDLSGGLARLAAHDDVVLGPSADGGYWLIGMNAALPALFTDMAWGTATVYRDTVDRLQARKIRWSALPLRHDIDTPEDVAAFADVLVR